MRSSCPLSRPICQQLPSVDRNMNLSSLSLACKSFDQACPCQSKEQPILLLRGLCRDNTLDWKYTPKQLARSPNDLIILGQYTSRIRYSTTSSQWILTDAVSNVTKEILVSNIGCLIMVFKGRSKQLS